MFFYIYSSTPSILVITVEKKFAICFEFNIFLLLAPCWSELRHLAVQHMESRCPGYGVPLSRIWSPCCPGYGVPLFRIWSPCCPGFWLPPVQDFDSLLLGTLLLTVQDIDSRILTTYRPWYGIPASRILTLRFQGFWLIAVKDFGSSCQGFCLQLSRILTHHAVQDMKSPLIRILTVGFWLPAVQDFDSLQSRILTQRCPVSTLSLYEYFLVE